MEAYGENPDVQTIEEYAKQNEGADPKTCRHNVIQAAIVKVSPKIGHKLICLSCRTDITHDSDLLKRRNYEYDISHNVWVHTTNSRKL